MKQLIERTQPLLKWPGGKRWLARPLAEIFKTRLRRTYYEPFLGSAAVFIQLRPSSAVLSDLNAQLITTLSTLRASPNDVIKAVWKFSNSRVCYERVRRSVPRSDIGAAARFVFLNRTCWGGIYRLNRRGEFNVPFGNSKRVICRSDHVSALAKSLTDAQLFAGDFEAFMGLAGIGDVCYADPPYTTKGANNGFRRYNERLFSWDDQVRLASVSRAAAGRGAFVVVSAFWHREVLKLYPGWWAAEVCRTVCVGREIASRVPVSEALLFSEKVKVPLSLGAKVIKL